MVETKYFKFSDKMLQFAKLQIGMMSKDLFVYDKVSEAEYSIVEPFFRDIQDASVLDLGCGLGRMSVFLNKMIQNPSIHYILADGDCGDNIGKIKNGWNPKSVFYNKLDLTQLFCEENGLDNFSILDLKDGLSEFKNINIVFSFFAVGFHYPIEKYIDNLLMSASKDCIFIFGTRIGHYEQSPFSNILTEVYSAVNEVDPKEIIRIYERT